MDIVFMMKHAGSARNLEPALATLAERGHSVHLALDRDDESEAAGLLDRLCGEHPAITVGPGPRKARERWSPYARDLRLGIDYLRYLEPRYADAAKLRARARHAAPARLVQAIALPGLRTPAGRRAIRAALRAAEAALPAPRKLEAYFRKRRPDVVAVVPLVGLGSSQADYVRAARALGIPTVLPVFSWDNLTNKGLLRESPDVVAVWNAAQAREAVELHGVPAERVVVTGAPAFDHWFGWAPSRDRAAFCADAGVPADRPLLLYLCSSPFIAPDEVGFVRRWLAAVRAQPELGDVAVLVRPHPQNAAQWEDVAFDDDDRVAVFPRGGANPVTASARADYYDSLHHAAAVIGVNTSALIESAIVDRPVLSVLDDQFAPTQTGTLHFHHLADAGTGVLSVDASLPEHTRRLAAAVTTDAPWWPAQNRRFLEAFVRPFGLNVPAGPCVADAIEAAGRRAAAPETVAVRAARAAVRRVVPPPAKAVKAATPRRDPIAEARAAVAALAVGDEPVVAGPWISEVGYELLYWVPFLTWAVETHHGLAERLTIVSRGGTGAWYEHLGARYVDLLDRLAPEALEARARAAADDGDGLRKQMAETGLDRDLLALAVPAPHAVLHPALMYRVFWALVKQRGLVDSDASRDLFRHRRPGTGGADGLGLDLPDHFIAVRFYFRASFPETPDNVAFVRRALDAMAEVAPVVLLNPGRRYDDHSDYEPRRSDRLVRLDGHMTPQTNLAVQTAAVARAQALVGTYGGLSYLGPLLGVPTVAVYSDRARFKDHHVAFAERVFAEAPFARLHVRDATELSGDRLAGLIPIAS